MAKKYLDYDGLLYLWQKIRNTFVSDVAWDSTNKKLVKKKKTGTNGAEQSSDLVTFATVATTGSYNDLSNTPTIPVLKNVFGKVKVGSTTIEADTTQDTLELEAGSNVTLTPDATNDKVTIGFSGTIPTIPNNFGTVKVGSTNVVADTTSDTLELVAGSNVTLTPDATNDKVTIAATDTTYSNYFTATQTSPGIAGLVPAPSAGIVPMFLNNNAYWQSLGFKNESDTSILQGAASASNTISYKLKSATSSLTGLMPSTDKAKLDSLTITDGIIDPSNLPSYVDDVIEAYPRSGQTELSSTWLSTSSGGSALTPETGKIYVLMADSTSYSANTQFRWSGTTYVKLADGGVSEITNAEIDTIVAS